MPFWWLEFYGKFGNYVKKKVEIVRNLHKFARCLPLATWHWCGGCHLPNNRRRLKSWGSIILDEIIEWRARNRGANDWQLTERRKFWRKIGRLEQPFGLFDQISERIARSLKLWPKEKRMTWFSTFSSSTSHNHFLFVDMPKRAYEKWNERKLHEIDERYIYFPCFVSIHL